MLGKIKRCILHLMVKVFWIFPIDRQKVFCVNYYGKGFGDNPKAVALKLLEKDTRIKIMWATQKQYKESLPERVYFVKYHSLRYYYEMATSAIWLDNCRKERDAIKRKGQYYIQLWHGTVPLKKIEEDAEEQLDQGYIKEAKWDSELVDLMTSGCEFFSTLCEESFWYQGEVLKSGEPRVDVLFQKQEENKNRVKQHFGIGEETRVVLYAPTFRTDGRMDCYGVDFERILTILKNKTKQDWVFLVRLHPNISSNSEFIQYTNSVMNATFYPDLYELFSVVDVLITDYSSLMFDAGVLKKPVYLFANDVEDYVKERGFYFELEKLPFTLAHSNEELIQHMQNFESKSYSERLQKFYTEIGYYPAGNAAEKIADKILEVLN